MFKKLLILSIELYVNSIDQWVYLNDGKETNIISNVFVEQVLSQNLILTTKHQVRLLTTTNIKDRLLNLCESYKEN